MGLSERGGVMGAITKQYLLEKSRVPFQSKGERATASSTNGSPHYAALKTQLIMIIMMIIIAQASGTTTCSTKCSLMAKLAPINNAD